MEEKANTNKSFYNRTELDSHYNSNNQSKMELHTEDHQTSIVNNQIVAINSALVSNTRPVTQDPNNERQIMTETNQRMESKNSPKNHNKNEKFKSNKSYKSVSNQNTSKCKNDDQILELSTNNVNYNKYVSRHNIHNRKTHK